MSFEVLSSIFPGMAEMQFASRPATDLHPSGILAGCLGIMHESISNA